MSMNYGETNDIERLLESKQYHAIIEKLRPLEPDEQVDRYFALAAVRRIEQKSPSCSLREHHAVCEEACGRLAFLLCGADKTGSRGWLLDLLRQAAVIADANLAAILADREFTDGSDSPASHKMLKSYYLGGAFTERGSVGQNVLRQKREIAELKPPDPAIFDGDWYIQFLKVYSSFTTLLPQSWNACRAGGGYFLALGGYGCVIDPGHHFLNNFFKVGHQITDIDAIIVTHFHDDHMADLFPLLSLLHHSARSDRPIALFLDRQTRAMFEPMLRTSTFIAEPRTLLPTSSETFNLCPGVRLTALPTKHNVHGDNCGVGVCLDVARPAVRLVVTGDTGWCEAVETRYRELQCDNCILVAHVSTVWPDELFSAFYTKTNHFYPKHLAIHGLSKAIEILRPSAVVLSEIGEEFDVDDGLSYLCSLIKKYYSVGKCVVGSIKNDDGKVYLE